MPNGFSGSKEDWQRIEAPLLEIDGVLKEYAQAHRMKLSKNYHDWPERSLAWGKSVRRLIQIYLENPQTMTFNFWICASQDRRWKRYWKNQFLKKAVPFSEIRDELQQLLEEGRKICESWSEHDLEFASRIAKLPPI